MEETGESTPQPAPPAMTPPTELGGVPDRPSGWPTAIGVIGIIFGILGILLYGCGGLVGNVVMAVFSGSVPEEQQAQVEVMRRYLVFNLANSVLAAGLATWLLVAAIGILRRRPWSRPAALSWAIAKMVYAVPAGVLGYVMNRAQVQAAMEAAGSDGQVPRGFYTIIESLGAVGMGCSLLWAWALPVFLIVWFLRAPIRDEVGRWALESRAAI